MIDRAHLRLLGTFGLALALPVATALNAASAQPTAAPVPQPCAACHLPTGAGIPGAFPPLRENVVQLAASKAGRRYLVQAVTHGLSGPLAVDGKRYNGAMPAQQVDNAQLAATLNRIIAANTKAAGPARFSTQEVAAHRGAAQSDTPNDIARTRPPGQVR